MRSRCAGGRPCLLLGEYFLSQHNVVGGNRGDGSQVLTEQPVDGPLHRQKVIGGLIPLGGGARKEAEVLRSGAGKAVLCRRPVLLARHLIDGGQDSGLERGAVE